MRNVVLQEWITLDSLAAGPNGSVDFVPASTTGDRSFAQDQIAFIDTVDTILLGRVTYQMFAGYWPFVIEGDEKPFADKLNATPKLVISRTLDRAPWGTWDAARIVKDDPVSEVSALKRQSGRSIVLWGSISLAQTLMAAGLIDEYRLIVCPLVLGSGRPLFQNGFSSAGLMLMGSKSFDRGCVSLQYVPRAS